MNEIVPQERIDRRIVVVRGQKVMIDMDLASLYEVSTKALNQAVKRNRNRFPEDFAFKLTKAEMAEVVTICDHLTDFKYSYQLPYVFTEQGVAMLSSVLRSAKAVAVNIQIMRAFVRLRNVIAQNKELAAKMNELERRVGKHDGDILLIFEAIRKLMEPPPEKPKARIGFRP